MKPVSEKQCCAGYNHIKGLIASHLDTRTYHLPFEKIQDLKYGELQKCRVCHTVWHIHQNDPSASVITPDKLEMFLEWNKKDLSVKPEFTEVLSKIGCTPPPLYGKALKEHIEIPCKCTLDNGSIIDYCTVNIQRRPPFYQKHYKNIIFIDRVVKIEPSEFCLPLDVRTETTKKGYYEEVDEYDPVIIEAPNGEIYYIDYGDNFFNEEGLKAKEMKVMSYSSKSLGKNPKFIKNKPAETQIIADWTVGLEEFFRG